MSGELDFDAWTRRDLDRDVSTPITNPYSSPSSSSSTPPATPVADSSSQPSTEAMDKEEEKEEEEKLFPVGGVQYEEPTAPQLEPEEREVVAGEKIVDPVISKYEHVDTAADVPAAIAALQNSRPFKPGFRRVKVFPNLRARAKRVLCFPFYEFPPWLRVTLMTVFFLFAALAMYLPKYIPERRMVMIGNKNNLFVVSVDKNQMGMFVETARIRNNAATIKTIQRDVDRGLPLSPFRQRLWQETQARYQNSQPYRDYHDGGADNTVAGPRSTSAGGDNDERLRECKVFDEDGICVEYAQLAMKAVYESDISIEEYATYAEEHRAERRAQENTIVHVPISVRDLPHLAEPIDEEMMKLQQMSPRYSTAEDRARDRWVSWTVFRDHILIPRFDSDLLPARMLSFARGPYSRGLDLAQVTRMERALEEKAKADRERQRKLLEKEANKGGGYLDGYDAAQRLKQQSTVICSEYTSIFNDFIYLRTKDETYLLLEPELMPLYTEDADGKTVPVKAQDVRMRSHEHTSNTYLQSVSDELHAHLGIESNSLLMGDRVVLKYQSLPSAEELTRFYGKRAGHHMALFSTVFGMDAQQRVNASKQHMGPISRLLFAVDNYYTSNADREWSFSYRLQSMIQMRRDIAEENRHKLQRLVARIKQREDDDKRAGRVALVDAVVPFKVHDPRTYGSIGMCRNEECVRRKKYDDCTNWIKTIEDVRETSDDQLYDSGRDAACITRLLTPPQLKTRVDQWYDDEALRIGHCMRVKYLMRLNWFCQHEAATTKEMQECGELQSTLKSPRFLDAVFPH